MVAEVQATMGPMVHGREAMTRERLPLALLVLAFNRDACTRIVGGTQILATDGQTRFAGRGAIYLHLPPATPALCPVQHSGGGPLCASLDGVEIGFPDAHILAGVLSALGGALADERLLVCHCLLAHDVSCPALPQPQWAVFWVHDCPSPVPGFERGTARTPSHIAHRGHPGAHKGRPGFVAPAGECIANPACRRLRARAVAVAGNVPVRSLQGAACWRGHRDVERQRQRGGRGAALRARVGVRHDA
ncbi:MAG: hypothetical protein ACRYHQ_10265 [Janthinobacterium lividum]